ncbi:hypothetical protein CPB86DRAFT_248760 [Serendipita vermifera]|nr:hypothetical protein CPB86DRAFT_248760 [Serendipita vermifera]
MEFDFLTLFPTHVNTKYILVSFQACIIYETIITVDRSVELFWNQPWNAAKTLFLINRYAAIVAISLRTLDQFMRNAPTTVCSNFAGRHSEHYLIPRLFSSHGNHVGCYQFCHVSLWLGFIGSAFLVSSLNLTMLSRINALWSFSRLVTCIARFLSLANILGFIIWGSYGWSKATVIPQAFPFTGCSVIPPESTKFNMIFLPSFVFETSVVILTIIKVYPMVWQAPGRLPLLTMLLSDGIAYYIIIMVAQTFVFGVSFSPNLSLLLPVCNSAPAILVGTIACGRLLIRLQELLVKDETTESEMIPDSSIVGWVWDGTTRDENNDIRLLPTTHGERRIQEPSSTLKGEV